MIHYTSALKELETWPGKIKSLYKQHYEMMRSKQALSEQMHRMILGIHSDLRNRDNTAETQHSKITADENEIELYKNEKRVLQEHLAAARIVVKCMVQEYEAKQEKRKNAVLERRLGKLKEIISSNGRVD